MTILPRFIGNINQKRKYQEPEDDTFKQYNLHLSELKNEFELRLKNNIEKREITVDDLKFLKVISKGSFSLTVHSKDHFGKHFIVKILSQKKIDYENKNNTVKIKNQLMQAIRFPFILHMEYSFNNKNHLYFIFPFLSHEDMFSYLQKVNRIPERNVKFYAAQILLAIEYLHNLDIMHRHICPEQIIFDSKGYLKLADCQFMKNNCLRTYSVCGINEYLPPEILLCKGYGKWVDWWAFGILLYEMTAGFTPFYSPDPLDICEKIIYQNIEFNQRFSKNFQNLLSNILQKNISMRYGNLKNGCLDIKCHEWFEIIDWQNLYNREITAPFIPEDNFNYKDEAYLALKHIECEIDDL